MKALNLLLLACALVTMFGLGFLSTPAPSEVPVYYPVVVERQWEQTMILGLTPDGELKELEPDADESGYVYIITIRMDRSDSATETTIWLPYADGFVGIGLMLSADDFEIETRQGGAFEQAEVPAEGDDF